MRKKAFIVTFFLMVFAGIGGFYMLRGKLYPAAFVNWHVVGARLLERQSAAAYQYYEKAAATYADASSPPPKEAVFREVRRAVFDKLVENILVEEELERRVSRRELAALIAEKLQPVKADDGDFKNAVASLYGLDAQDFFEMVLRPQARKEILQSQFAGGTQGNFTGWLAQARAEAKVIMIAHLFRWDGQQVQFK